MRYTYLGDKWTSEHLAGLQCDPVRLSNGKCVVGAKTASALVEDQQGNRYVVMRRRLRLNSKLKDQKDKVQL